MSKRSFCHGSQWIDADTATAADFYAYQSRSKLTAYTVFAQAWILELSEAKRLLSAGHYLNSRRILAKP